MSRYLERFGSSRLWNRSVHTRSSILTLFDVTGQTYACAVRAILSRGPSISGGSFSANDRRWKAHKVHRMNVWICNRKISNVSFFAIYIYPRKIIEYVSQTLLTCLQNNLHCKMLCIIVGLIFLCYYIVIFLCLMSY